MTACPDLDDLLRARLRAAGVDLPASSGPDRGPWQAWLLLRELEAADRWAGTAGWHR